MLDEELEPAKGENEAQVAADALKAGDADVDNAAFPREEPDGVETELAGKAEDEPVSMGAGAANKAAGMALGVARGAADTLKAGAFAVRDVHKASRQSAGARAQARTIQEALEADRKTLEHRREIESSFDSIISEQSGIVARNQATIDSDQQKIDGLSEEHSALTSDLDELKASNASAIRPYKRLVETSKEEFDDAQRMLAEAKRAVKVAETQLNDAKERRDSSFMSASRSFDNSQARQRRVQDELKKLQASGGAPAAISQMQSDNVAALASVDSAKAEVARATKDGQNAVDNAQTHLWTQNQSLASAQSKYDAALAKHKAHKAEHDKMSDDAAAQEKELQERIDGKKRSLDALRAELEDAQEALDEAQGLIDEANLIHSTPEETERLERAIADQQADLDEANSEVEHLAATEKQLRQATRGSRVALIAAAVLVLIVVAVIVASCTAK